MKSGKRRLLINWSNAHEDLKRLVEQQEPYDRAIAHGKGWSYVTFLSKEIRAQNILFDIDRLRKLAEDNHYYLPRDVVIQHNKVVVTACPDGDAPVSSLTALHLLLTAYCKRHNEVRKYPVHEFYGKFGGIYERPEKGRVLAVYTGNDDALLEIHEAMERLAAEVALPGIRFELRLANGLSAIPRMLHGFDDPDYHRSGVGHYKITDPNRFTVLLNQARHDYDSYPFDT